MRLENELSLLAEHTRGNEASVKLCIVQTNAGSVSETFIRAHVERLPAKVTVVHGQIPMLGDQPALSQSVPSRALRKVGRLLTGRSWNWEITASYLKAFRNCQPDVVLAEYGPMGVAVMPACELADIPLIVHFHGSDASVKEVLSRYRNSYREMFQKAGGVVAVSSAMKTRLLEMGADPEKTHLNVYGIDCHLFDGASPETSSPTFLAVGRFVEKKAPHLTLLAFAEVVRQVPEAKLRMVGEGPLHGLCRDLTTALKIADAVTFLGAQPHDVVAEEMRNARAFVQHSIEASNGDCEGTPLAILEAGATGVPVVSTRHAGIPDVVVDGETGFLVAEKDIAEMAERMLRLAKHSELAADLGRAARDHISREFSMDKSIGGLYRILSEATSRKNSLTGNGVIAAQ